MFSYFQLVPFAANRGRVRKTLEAAYRSVVDGLRRDGVPFLLHGAFAMAAHGSVRATVEVDFLVPSDPAAMGSVFRLMARIGAVPASPGRRSAAEALRRAGLPVSFHLAGGAFDFFPDGALGRLRRRAVRRRFGGRTVPIVGRADPMTRIRARGTLQDLADVERLRVRPRRGGASACAPSSLGDRVGATHGLLGGPDPRPFGGL